MANKNAITNTSIIIEAEYDAKLRVKNSNEEVYIR